MNTFQLEVVTPEARVFSGDVKFVTVPGVEGDLGLLPDHVPLLTQIHAGELQITSDAGEMVLAVGEGFLEVRQDRISVLTDMAVKEEDIDEKAASEAVERAERQIREGALSGEGLATVQASLIHSLAQLKVKRRIRR